jgi:NitT/TauT family transport system substrate-binding protein
MDSFRQQSRKTAGRRRFVAGAGALVVGSAILLGMGGVAEAMEQASLRLKWLTQAQFAGFYVAKAKGFYEEVGIDLTINPGGPNLNADSLVASGADTFGLTGGVESHLAARDKGLPLVAIGVAHLKTPYTFVTYDDSGIEKLEDFKGKTISSWFSGSQHTLRAMLATAGLKEGDYEMVPQSVSMNPFIEKDVDVAVATLYNEYQTLLEKGVTNLRLFQPDDFGITAQRDTLVATETLIKEKPELVQNFLNATLKGWQYALQHQDEAVDIIIEADPSLERAHQEAMIKMIAEVMVPEGASMLFAIQYDALQAQHDILMNAGVFTNPVDVKAAFDDSFLKAAPDGIKLP